MPEAVIVATARSPIGRAFKGSLKDLRPDDLAATIVRAALDKVPALDPSDIDDLMLGCGLPGGEQGYNMGRVVSVLLGMDHLPGTTITRYCSSSLQTTRMAHARDQGRRGRRLHLRRRGDGVPVRQGQQRLACPTPRTRCSPTRRPGGPRSPRAAPTLARPARGRRRPRHLHRHGPDRREPRAAQGRLPPGDGRVRRAQPEPRRGGHQQRLLGAGDHPGHHARRHRRQQGRRPARRHHRRGARRSSSRSSAPTAG